MQLPRLTPSILMLPTLASGIVFNFAQIAQSASLLSPSSNIVEPLSVDLNFNLAPGGADQSTAIFAILTEISNSTNKIGISPSRTASGSKSRTISISETPIVSVSEPQTASAPSTQPRQGFSLQSLFTSLSRIRLAEKGDTLRPIPVLDAIQGTDVNEGIYTFRNSGNAGNASLSGQIGIPNNALQIVQGGGLFRPAGLAGSPINPFPVANQQDVEFNLVPENTLQTSLGTAYQTSLSGAVGDLDSKFSLTIKTELRLLPDPILITASNLELQDFGTSKLTEPRENSLYALQGNLNEKFQETTNYIQKRIEERERDRYVQRQRDKNPIVSGTISEGANRQFSSQSPLNSVQSPLNSSLIPISYATPNRAPANFSNTRGRAPSRNLLSNPQLSPQPLKTLPGNF